MPNVIQQINAVPAETYVDKGLRRQSRALATATTEKVFGTGLTTTATMTRQGVIISNTDASAYLFLYLVPNGAAAPTVSSTVWNIAVPPLSSVPVQAGQGVDIYMRHNSASSVTVNAVEFA